MVSACADMIARDWGQFMEFMGLFNYLGVRTVTGSAWEGGTIKGMLENEKYKGDFHLQKYYTPENKRNQTVRNRGQVQSYYITEDHEPIVPAGVWNEAQRVREEHRKQRGIEQDTGKYQNRYTGKTEFERRGEGGTECTEASDGGVLPGVNRPRRTVIKL